MTLKIEILGCDVTCDMILGPIISLAGILGLYTLLFDSQKMLQPAIDHMPPLMVLFLVFMLICLILVLLPMPRTSIKEFIRECENDPEMYSIGKSKCK